MKREWSETTLNDISLRWTKLLSVFSSFCPGCPLRDQLDRRLHKLPVSTDYSALIDESRSKAKLENKDKLYSTMSHRNGLSVTNFHSFPLKYRHQHICNTQHHCVTPQCVRLEPTRLKKKTPPSNTTTLAFFRTSFTGFSFSFRKCLLSQRRGKKSFEPLKQETRRLDSGTTNGLPKYRKRPNVVRFGKMRRRIETVSAMVLSSTNCTIQYVVVVGFQTFQQYNWKVPRQHAAVLEN